MTIHADLRPIEPDDTTVNAPMKSRLPRWPYMVVLVLVIAWAGYYFVHRYQWDHSLTNSANPQASQINFVFPLSSAGTHASFVATTDKAMYSLDPVSRSITVYRRGGGEQGWLHGTTSTLQIPLVPLRENGVAQPLVGLAVSAQGVVYTLDVANRSVVRVDSSGRINTGWASAGVGVPVGVVVSKSGNIDVLGVETSYPSGLLTSITQVTPSGHVTPHWATLPGMGTAIAASTLFDSVYVGHAGSVGPDRNTIDVVQGDGKLWTAPIMVPATAKLGDRTYSYDPAGIRPYGVAGPGQYLAEYNGSVYLRYDATGSTVATLAYGGGAIQEFRRFVDQSGSANDVVALTSANASNTSVPLLGITSQEQFAGFRHGGNGM
jgi:hypothetical protein